jgi:hypothetical protein
MTIVCFGEQVEVKYDKDAGKFYIEEKTTTGIEKVVVEDGDAKLTYDEEKTKSTSLGVNLSKDSIGITMVQKKHWKLTKTYVKKGGRLELPVFESCMLDKECRTDILSRATDAIKNGIGKDEPKQLN